MTVTAGHRASFDMSGKEMPTETELRQSTNCWAWFPGHLGILLVSILICLSMVLQLNCFAIVAFAGMLIWRHESRSCPPSSSSW